MKIAVTSMGQEISSQVDPRFGRAAYFIVYDSESKEYTVYPNTENAQAAQGAGVQAAQTVANSKADLVVSGNMGPKAFAALKAAGIKVITWHEGSVEQAVNLVLENKLQVLDGANVQGHW